MTSLYPTRSSATATARTPVADRIRAIAEDTDAAVRERVALRTADHAVSYATLWERAQKTGADLSALGVGVGDIVGIRLPSGPDAVVAMLASWLVGAAFLPMDVTVPDDYRDQMLSRSGARAAVDGEGLRTLAGVGGSARPQAGRPGDRAAYAIYTSGSSGSPKGVLVGHEALGGHVAGISQLLGLRHTDTVLQFAGLGFDVAQEEIWPTLAAGGTVAFLDSGDRALSPADLAQRVRELGVSVLQLPTAYWRLVCAQIQGAQGVDVDFTGVHTVVVGGEGAGTRDVHVHRDGPLGHCTLVNGYGPTETVVTCTALVLRADEPVPATTGLPIGGPVGERRLHVLDADLRPVAPGSPGELWIGGSLLADGYLGDPVRTAESFRSDPFSPQAGARMYRTGDLVLRHPDGALEYLGRLDNQVKVRGYRIELDEVERHLIDTRGVTAAAAVALDDGTGTGGRTLAAAVCVTADGPTGDRIREDLRGRLPRHMVPGRIHVFGALPLTTSGKIDRRAVGAMVAGAGGAGGFGSEAAAPAADDAADQAAELTVLLDTVRTLLRAPDFGPDDDFLARGGDSLAALRVSGAMRERGWRLRPSDLVAVGNARAVAARMKRC
ncbi:non-ribosomal peptide synthetase [Actinacidiphila sp. ITFR-21]|uniref:non-ribosomal peptide synthetase n=1 Tax=Actinacidiphila sp. ITFR-21 TaxID=3075199 RepID=UPI00288A5343|nr:non-ribosomal peptide synthetase [Streptomyces sp. ITFR-21]WNI18067.1 non-ribosomal peptide synthetase [Streptomyces sp. ITFR-21]